MHGNDVKARLLSAGTARFVGGRPPAYVSSSTAGPGAGGEGSVFFRSGELLVRLGLSDSGPVEIEVHGDGSARLTFGDITLDGELVEVGLHCPGQAYITVSSGCIFHCRYCNVPNLPRKRKTIPEIHAMVAGIRDRIHAISITSGVFSNVAEEEDYVCEVVTDLLSMGLPIGVSIYPTEETPDRLHALGVREVKFNLECATPALFEELCPGHDRARIIRVLRRSVSLFGKNHVFSNIILGLGETDEEMEACISELAWMGVVPVVRPLNPVAGFSGAARPDPGRLLKILHFHEQALHSAGLDTGKALTMCVRCQGCDLVPGGHA